MSQEAVILVDEDNRVLGTMPKADVHGERTPLHRGFSCFVFHAHDHRLLIQQRSAKKKTWPLIWSNSCCGHPALAESTLQAARRRLDYELGLHPTLLDEVASYRYCFTRDGVMENEICPVLVGIVEDKPIAHPDEVAATSWVHWDAFLSEIEQGPARFSEWCIEEAKILSKTAICRQIIGA